jgi:hypothetical protein
MQAWRARPGGRFGAVAAVLVLAAVPACVAGGPLTGRATENWERTYDLAPGGTFEVRNSNGRVEVEGVDEATVQVRAERIVKSTSDEAAREVLDRLGIDEDVSPDHVSLRTRTLDGIVIGVNTETNYHIRAPRSLTINIRTTNGDVHLTGVEGSTTAQTTNGAITGIDLKGAIEARTTNGAMRIDVDEVKSPIQLRTTNGGIVLGLPATTAANLSLSAVNGGVSVTGLPFEATGEQTRRRIRGTLNGGGPAIEATTTNGSVRVRTRAEAAADDGAAP